MKYDIDFINPLGNPGTLYALEADSPKQALDDAPYWLSVSSHWRPDQFQVIEARVSIHADLPEVTRELRQDQHA